MQARIGGVAAEAREQRARPAGGEARRVRRRRRRIDRMITDLSMMSPRGYHSAVVLFALGPEGLVLLAALRQAIAATASPRAGAAGERSDEHVRGAGDGRACLLTCGCERARGSGARAYGGGGRRRAAAPHARRPPESAPEYTRCAAGGALCLACLLLAAARRPDAGTACIHLSPSLPPLHRIRAHTPRCHPHPRTSRLLALTSTERRPHDLTTLLCPVYTARSPPGALTAPPAFQPCAPSHSATPLERSSLHLRSDYTRELSVSAATGIMVSAACCPPAPGARSAVFASARARASLQS